MDTTSTPSPARPPLTPSQIQSWSVLSNLAFLLGYVIPFGGILAVFLIHITMGKQDSRVRASSAAALNVELTFWLVMLVTLVACAAIALIVILVTGTKDILVTTGPVLLLGGAIFFGAVTLGYAVYRLVAGVLNALKVSEGGQPHYSLSIDFV